MREGYIHTDLLGKTVSTSWQTRQKGVKWGEGTRVETSGTGYFTETYDYMNHHSFHVGPVETPEQAREQHLAALTRIVEYDNVWLAEMVKRNEQAKATLAGQTNTLVPDAFKRITPEGAAPFGELVKTIIVPDEEGDDDE